MSLQYPQEYAEFARHVKTLVVLNIIMRTLDFDEQAIKLSNAKLTRAYEDVFHFIRGEVEKELKVTKREIRETGGTIVDEVQLPYAREVHAKFRGFLYKQQYLNDLLRAECEEKLRHYLIPPRS